MRVRERPSFLVLRDGLQRSQHSRAAERDVSEELGLRENTVGKAEGVFVEGFRWCPCLELAREVVVERQQRVVAQEPRGGTVKAPVRGRTCGRLLGPQIGLPQIVGTVTQRCLHQAKRNFEVVGQTLLERACHAMSISTSSRL